MRIGVIGTGFVGLVTGACLAEKGHTVTCIDKNAAIVEKINKSEATIHEEGLPEILTKVRQEKSLSSSVHLKDAVEKAEVIIIAVGTPYSENSIDLTYIKSAAKEIGELLKEKTGYSVVVVKSTVVPTTTEKVVIPLLEKYSGKKAGRDFGVGMNPEFLREGSAVYDFRNPDRIVIGCIDKKSGSVLTEMYAGFDTEIMLTTMRTAEMIKYVANSLLASMISFSNECAAIASSIGDMDIKEVMRGVHLDNRLSPIVDGKRVFPGITSYLEAGCGFGGSCFPKDVKALISFAKDQSVDPRILNAVITTNETQPLQVIDLLLSKYPDIKGKRIVVLGLAFKPGTNDVRESPAIPIIEKLLKTGAEIIVHDPVVKEEFNDETGTNIQHAPTWQSAIKNADAVLLITSWPEYQNIRQKDLDENMNFPFIIDGRRMLDPKEFTPGSYFGIGYQIH